MAPSNADADASAPPAAPSTPEQQVKELASQLLEEFRTKMPTGSSSIVVADRKTIHRAVEKLYGCVNQVVGVLMDVRFDNGMKDVENVRLRIKIADLEKKLSERRSESTSDTASEPTTASKNSKNVSYAAAAKKPSFSVLIEPENREQTSETTKKEVMKSIDPASSRLEIEGVRKTKNGGVIVKCAKVEDVDAIKQAILLKTQNLHSKEIKKNRPRVLLPGIARETEEAELVRALYEQNKRIRECYIDCEEFTKDMRVITHLKNAWNEQTKSVVVEVSPKLRNVLLLDIVWISWKGVRVRDHVSVLQCFKCYELGHKAAACEKQQLCGNCGEVGHDFKTCTSKNKRCILCTLNNKQNKEQNKTNHDSRAAECPTLKKIKIAITNTIDYHGY